MHVVPKKPKTFLFICWHPYKQGHGFSRPFTREPHSPFEGCNDKILSSRRIYSCCRHVYRPFRRNDGPHKYWRCNMQWLFDKALGSKFIAYWCNTTDIEQGVVFPLVFQHFLSVFLANRHQHSQKFKSQRGERKCLRLFSRWFNTHVTQHSRSQCVWEGRHNSHSRMRLILSELKMDFDALRIVSNRWHLRRWKTVSEIVTFRCGSCFYVIFSFINTIRWWLWLVVACQGCLWTLCLLLWEHGVWWWGRGEYCLDFPGTVS